MAEKITHKSEGADLSPLSESGIDMLENYTCLSPKCSFFTGQGSLMIKHSVNWAACSTLEEWFQQTCQVLLSGAVQHTREGNEQTEDRRLR